jgi:hypothetical protein
VALASPVDVAERVYPLPVWSILRSANAAIPLEAFLTVVPVNAPPPGFVPIAMEMEADEDVMVFPWLSWTATVGGPTTAPVVVELPG